MTDQALSYLNANAVPSGGPAWLDVRRKAARASFSDAGFPNRRVEAWRYTDLARLIAKTDWTPSEQESGAVLPPEGSRNPFAAISSWVIVFVNGFFRPDLSSLDEMDEGLEIVSLDAALASGTKFEAFFDASGPEAVAPMAALNAACARDGAVIRVGEGVELSRPVQLVHYTTSGDARVSHTRHVIELGVQASMTLLEAQVGWGGAYLADRMTNITLAEGSTLTHVRVQDDDVQALHLSTVLAEISTNASYKATTLATGGLAGRLQTAIRFTGEGAHGESNTAYLMRGHQHIDTTIIVDHAVPACTSEALAKGVLDGGSTGVFQGKVIVAPHAQKSDAQQMSNVLLLSGDAAMNAKPELEIYADDVLCAHGSTVGEIDEEALFYLRSRGIDEEAARRLLIGAFLSDVLERIAHEAAREALIERASNWFETAKTVRGQS